MCQVKGKHGKDLQGTGYLTQAQGLKDTDLLVENSDWTAVMLG